MKPIIWYLTIFFLLPSIAVAAQEPDPLEPKYQQAKDLYYDGKYEEAGAILEEILQQKRQEGSRDEFLLRVLLRIGKNERYLRRHERALNYLRQGLALAEELHGAGSENAADLMFEIGSTYSQMYDLPEAQRWHNRCLQIYRNIYGEESSEVANMYMNFGINALKQGSYGEAERQMQRALLIFNKVSEPESEDFNRIYSNLGYLYRKTGNYERAIDYGTRALEIKLLHYAPGHPSVAKYHFNLARVYLDLGEPEKGLPYMLKAIDILEGSLGPEHPTTAGSYGELGDIYAEMGEYETAMAWYRKSDEIQARTMPATHPYRIAGYFNIGRLYEDQRNYEAALDYYQQTLELFRSADFAPPQYVSMTQRKIADVYLQEDRVEEALARIQESLSEIAPGFNPAKGDYFANPNPGPVQSPLDLLETLQLKVRALERYYEIVKQQEVLEAAFHTLQIAVALTDSVKKGYVAESDRALLTEQSRELLEDAVRIAYSLYQMTSDGSYLREAFRLSDKGKSGMLWQDLHAADALLSADVPVVLRDSMQQLEARIIRMEEQLSEEPDAEGYQKLLDMKIAYGGLVEALESSAPEYYQLKFVRPDVDPDALDQKLRQTNSILISYFYDERDVYIFLCRAGQEPEVIRSSHGFNLEVWISSLTQVYRNALTESEQYFTFQDQLYELLIAPIRDQLKQGQSLVIIPYGMLNYVSFEALASPSPETDLRRRDYLIRSHPVRYDWSAAFWSESGSKRGAVELPYAGFAPDFSAPADAVALRGSLSALPEASGEVERAATALHGQAFIGPEATEDSFLEAAAKAGILHLATHALLDDEDPLSSGLVFTPGGEEDGYLRALEIYKLHLPARLAVMSACNTGNGELRRGEGVMSLARAFAHAGCESSVMSLWPANDASSAAIMDAFFAEMADGASPEEALHRAKLSYLETADALTAHPFFWGHLVLIGESQALPSKRNYLLIFGAAFGILMIGLYLRRLFQ